MDDEDVRSGLPEAKSEDTATIEQAGNDKVHRASPSVRIFASTGKQASQAFGSLAAPAIKNLAGAFAPLNTANWFPHIQMTNLLLPQLKLPIADISRNLTSNILRQQTSITADLAATLFRQQHEQWEALFASVRTFTEALLPPNWRSAKLPDLVTIETIALDEGIPLVWIPCAETLQAVFDAPDAVRRRQVIGRRWQRIASDCEVALGEVSHATLRCHQPFAADVVRALRDGHPSAAQALAANLLDSILRRNFAKDELKIVTTNRKGGNRLDLDDYQVKAAFTLAPIWRAYAEYWEDKGDPIPRSFGRHPSAHAVSRTQYSRINAVMALMLVTSLLKLLDAELGR